LVGKGANGKSTLLRVWDKLLGSANVSHVPLEGLASEFRIHEMAGKLANIAGDMQRMEKVEEGILKQLISGEPIQVNRKHRVPVTMMPTAKMVFATNELPPINDRSDGIWRRMIVVPFSVQFPVDQRDTHRAENLTNELPGIVNWALAGARRLYQQGRFTICPICAACVEEHRIHSDPFQQFIAEETTRGPDVIIHTETLYKAYVRFCESNGRKPRNSSDFGKQVCGLPGVVRQRQSIGPRLYEYRGITCRSALYCGTFVTNHHAMFAAETMN
jgi:P4 family phage/plasmid primase-like protien